ncbi:MAG: serine/threonine protein kinase [Bradymonadales bacterium]|nr:serine/threonine protein kinase [Bradymonadales bacterium]
MSGRVLGGRFRLIRSFGSGGFGQVYLAEQLSMKRQVAVKIIHPHLARDRSVVQRFELEALFASQLTHPNTVVYFDFGLDEDLLFLAMEYVHGCRLDHLLVREAPLEISRMAHMARQICGSLEEAHAAGMVHRDLKPSNVLITRRGNDPDFVKVIDFGLAKIVTGEVEPGRVLVTERGAMLGTPAYMSPEQILGERVDHRCDIYSLGVLMFLMLTKRRPFVGNSPQETIQKHLYQEIPFLRPINPRVPERLEALVRCCLAKDRRERPASVSEISDQLEGWKQTPPHPRGVARQTSAGLLGPNGSLAGIVTDGSSAAGVALDLQHASAGSVPEAFASTQEQVGASIRQSPRSMSRVQLEESREQGKGTRRHLVAARRGEGAAELDVTPTRSLELPHPVVATAESRGQAASQVVRDLGMRGHRLDGRRGTMARPVDRKRMADGDGVTGSATRQSRWWRHRRVVVPLSLAGFLLLVAVAMVWLSGSVTSDRISPGGMAGWRSRPDDGDPGVAGERGPTVALGERQEEGALTARMPSDPIAGIDGPAEDGVASGSGTAAGSARSTPVWVGAEAVSPQGQEGSSNLGADVFSSTSDHQGPAVPGSERRSGSTGSQVRITAIPWGDVFCNNEALGRTPVNRFLPAGHYECVVRGPRGQTQPTRFELEPGETEVLRIHFNR